MTQVQASQNLGLFLAGKIKEQVMKSKPTNDLTLWLSMGLFG